MILDGAGTILQTIYEDDTTGLTAIAVDETSGKIATSTGPNVHIYQPYGLDEGALRVCRIEERYIQLLTRGIVVFAEHHIPRGLGARR